MGGAGFAVREGTLDLASSFFCVFEEPVVLAVFERAALDRPAIGDATCVGFCLGRTAVALTSLLMLVLLETGDRVLSLTFEARPTL